MGRCPFLSRGDCWRDGAAGSRLCLLFSDVSGTFTWLFASALLQLGGAAGFKVFSVLQLVT